MGFWVEHKSMGYTIQPNTEIFRMIIHKKTKKSKTVKKSFTNE